MRTAATPGDGKVAAEPLPSCAELHSSTYDVGAASSVQPCTRIDLCSTHTHRPHTPLEVRALFYLEAFRPLAYMSVILCFGNILHVLCTLQCADRGARLSLRLSRESAAQRHTRHGAHRTGGRRGTQRHTQTRGTGIESETERERAWREQSISERGHCRLIKIGC